MSPNIIKLARAALHFWEEPCISGTKGSGTVFFCGCNLRCVYCQNSEISGGGAGIPISDEDVMRTFDRLIEKGAHNLNLVTPTHYADSVARILEKYHSPVPIVYNCGGYESVETLKMLEGLVDIYLPDFKYADSALAAEYSHAPDYFERASEAIKEMNRQVGVLKLDSDGIAERGLIIPCAPGSRFKHEESASLDKGKSAGGNGSQPDEPVYAVRKSCGASAS